MGIGKQPKPQAKMKINVKKKVLELSFHRKELDAGEALEFTYNKGANDPEYATVKFVDDYPFADKVDDNQFKVDGGTPLLKTTKSDLTEETSYAFYVNVNPKAGGTIIVHPGG